MRSVPMLPQIQTIELGNTQVSYVVRRSPRAKHMRITISPHNGVVVTLPARLPQYINPEKLLREKQEWVLRHVAKVGQSAPPPPLGEGSIVHFQGRPHTLRLSEGEQRFSVRVAGDELRVALPRNFQGDLKETLKEWIRQRALEVIAVETAAAAARMGLEFSRLTIRDQKTKWGSCSKKGNLSFNWRLILFPPTVLRYVVIHELCHLKHFNHSLSFWKLVERYDPAYRDSIAWLKQHGPLMEGDLR